MAGVIAGLGSRAIAAGKVTRAQILHRKTHCLPAGRRGLVSINRKAKRKLLVMKRF